MVSPSELPESPELRQLRQRSLETVGDLQYLLHEQLPAAEESLAEIWRQIGRCAGTLHRNFLAASQLTHDLTSFRQAQVATDQEAALVKSWQKVRRAYLGAYEAARDGEEDAAC